MYYCILYIPYILLTWEIGKKISTATPDSVGHHVFWPSDLTQLAVFLCKILTRYDDHLVVKFGFFGFTEIIFFRGHPTTEAIVSWPKYVH